MNSYIPENHNHVSLYLVVKKAEPIIEFIKKVFNGKEIFRQTDSTGKIIHVQSLIKDTVIMIGEATKEFQPTKSHLHIYTKNVDETFQKAVENGAIVLRKPENKSDGDRRGDIKDPEGTEWTIATKKFE